MTRDYVWLLLKGVDSLKKYILAIAVLAVVMFASGCIDTGTDGNNTSSDTNQTKVIPETNNLVLTITDSNSSSGETYSAGDEININFSTSDKTFTLTDIWGTFDGTYSVSGNVLSLQFEDSTWKITLNSDGTFTGAEGDARDAGTYKWV